MPKISVIVPVYKVEAYLHRCVDSILAQTCTDFELILVDDGSPDNCGKICDEYAEKDQRIVVIHKENGGLSDARNAGIDWAFANSDSEWLSFIDSDDWIHKEYLNALYNAVQTTKMDISVCSYKRTDKFDYESFPESLEPVLWDAVEFFRTHDANTTVAWGKLYRKSLFEGLRYPFGKINEDEFVTYKIIFLNKKICFINAELYYYYKREGSIVASTWSERSFDVFEAGKQRIEFFEKQKNRALAELAVKGYIYFICTRYNSAKKRENTESALKTIKKEAFYCLKKYIRKYRKEFKNNPQIFNICFPRLFFVLKKIKMFVKRFS